MFATRPSRTCTTVRANAAMSGSCVTSRIVMPCAIEVAQQRHDLQRTRAVEVARRLVGEQHLRRGDDRARDRHALLLAPGEFGRRVVPPFGQADLLERGPGGPVAFARSLAAIEQRQLDVLERTRPAEQVEALEDEPEVTASQQRAFVAREPLDVHAAELELPGRGHVEAAENVHHRRLARSRRSHDCDEVSRGDVEVHAVQGVKRSLAAAEGLGDAAQSNQWTRCAGCSHGWIHDVSEHLDSYPGGFRSPTDQ